jgi:hypothetical protein
MDLQETLLTALITTEYLTDTDTRKIIHPHMHTHTHTQRVLCSINSKYFGASDLLGFHLRKVLYSKSNTS